MYYYYIMNTAKYSARTQISLPAELKSLIEKEGGLQNESLSEYLRKSAILRMALTSNRKNELKTVASAVVGHAQKSKGGWKAVSNVSLWQRNGRRDENSHRS